MVSVRSPMNPLGSLTLALAGAGVMLGSYFLLRKKPRLPEELERERREFLQTAGRITDGTVIDVHELEPDNQPLTLLVYQYDVGGVSYEASQDVTYLRPMINLQSCRLGLPTSVRYDPQNPANSMVISEKWMGLRQ